MAGPDTYHCEIASSLVEVLPHVAAWENLQTHSLEDNVYASPLFLTASLRHFKYECPYYIVFVYREGETEKQLVACAPLSLLPATWKVPFRAVSTFVSPHCYLSDPMLHKDFAPPALDAICDWIEQRARPWGLLILENVRKQSHVWPLLLNELHKRGRPYWVKETSPRAMLKRHASFDAYLNSLPSSRRKGYRRRWRQLQREGCVDVILHRKWERTEDVAARFLEIENKGWKGRYGSALAQNAADAAFFTEITQSSAHQGQRFFVELRLNHRTIAMTANFTQGGTLFAFKLAYDPEFKRFSPGILLEIETVRLFHESSDLTSGDGGTIGTSYLDSYWRERTELQLAYVATQQYWSRVYVSLIPWVVGAKRALARLPLKVKKGHSRLTLCSEKTIAKIKLGKAQL